MKAAWLSILFCTVALEGAAAPLELAPGSWEFTDLLRNFSISADGQHELEDGGSGPNTERACVTQNTLSKEDLYPGLKIPTVAAHCNITTISETPNLIDSVVECSAYERLSPYIEHTVVTAPTRQSFTIIREMTFLEPTYDGRISRSTSYSRGRWLKDSCDR
jgi:hypothetical protein